MSTKTKLETALKEAMKSGNDLRKRTIRMALSNIKNIEIDKRIPLDEPGLIAVLQKEIKTRSEVISDFEKGNRADLVEANRQEIAVLEEFLPKQLSEEEVTAIAKTAIAEVNAVVPADMGKVMKILIPRLEGRASNDVASRVVRSLLSSERK